MLELLLAEADTDDDWSISSIDLASVRTPILYQEEDQLPSDIYLSSDDSNSSTMADIDAGGCAFKTRATKKTVKTQDRQKEHVCR